MESAVCDAGPTLRRLGEEFDPRAANSKARDETEGERWGARANGFSG